MTIAVPPPNSPLQSPAPREWRMPSRDDFGRYVETTMTDVLRDLERDRRKMLRKIVVATVIVLGRGSSSFSRIAAMTRPPTML